MDQITFTQEVWKQILEASEKRYPREVCGLFFGPPEKQKNKFLHASKVDILLNILEPQHSVRLEKLISIGMVSLPKERMERGGAFEFLIDPEEHCQKIMQAQQQGLDQIGLFHSHPDHPAKPSATDSSQPMLAGWSNIIVSVYQGQFKEARSWFRNSETEPFQEQKIFVE